MKSLKTVMLACGVLMLLGDGPDKAKLQGLASRLGVAGRVRWVPWVNSWEVAQYINALDVLVLPSRTRWNIKEQFGRVLIEAMACETCVVGSDSGEISNVIGGAGLVFHEDCVEELAAKLAQLMNDSSLCETFRKRGRDRVLSNFTYAKIAAATVDFYRQVALGANTFADLQDVGSTIPL